MNYVLHGKAPQCAKAMHKLISCTFPVSHPLLEPSALQTDQ